MSESNRPTSLILTEEEDALSFISGNPTQTGEQPAIMSQTQTQTSAVSSAPASLRLEPQLEFNPIHKTFGAECKGIDFTKPVPKDVMDIVREQLGKFGVLVFRNTGLSDEQYLKLADEFGELADSPPVRRFDGPRGLGDPSNIYLDGSIVVPGDLKWFMAKET